MLGKKSKLMQKIIILVFLLITTYLPGISVKGSDISNEKSSSELWKEDIAHYKSTLKDKHINLYHSVNNIAFNQKIEDLTNKLSSLNEHEIIVEMMGITRSIGDGHTQFSVMGGPHEHYPFSLEWVEGKIRVMAASTKFKNLLGYELIAIDGMPLDKILDKIDPVIQGVENKYSLRSGYRWHLNVSELLYGLHITSTLGHATFTFFDEKKSQINITANAIPMNEFISDVVHRLSLDRGIFSHPDIKHSDGLWLSVNRQLGTAYLHFSNYPSRSDMQSFAEDVKEYLNKNNIQNLIIDLRENGGGDFFIGLLLANQLILIDDLNWNNGIYVLISERTYSAGMSNAAQYRSILNATLVGEPTGANPVGYQDADGFILPNSKRYVQYSKRMYRFQSKPTNGVIPDHHIVNDWESYTTGKDKQLAYITSLIRKIRDSDVQ
ncbi:S41 family peptidase [Microbulbifer sp. TRSA002]|uniref:S41 family peptidase n=1 Tax=Microbulbifer sp. TRSA002 TaxID=3243382 RepID=UPI004039087C